MRRTVKNLTVRYAFYQLVFFVSNAGIFAFAATYLTEKGFHTGQIGLILSLSNLVACLIQPLLGDFADRFPRLELPKVIALILTCGFACFLVIQLCSPPHMIFGLLYGIGGLLLSIIVPLGNSMCVYYSERSYVIDYGVGVGVASLSYSFASLGLGYVIAWLGADWMIWIVLLFMFVQILIVLGYPKISDLAGKPAGTEGKAAQELRQSAGNVPGENVSLLRFFAENKFFTITVLGVMLVAMCHAMAENYLIIIFQPLGGNSRHVGIALFIACLTAAPFQLFFDKVQKKISILLLMRLAGIFYVAKAVLLLLSRDIWHVYAIELIQTFTYGFIYPSLFYYARSKVAKRDTVKGQAVVTAAFTLGVSLGNFVGGRAIDAFGIQVMLVTAAVLAAAGTGILNYSVKK